MTLVQLRLRSSCIRQHAVLFCCVWCVTPPNNTTTMYRNLCSLLFAFCSGATSLAFVSRHVWVDWCPITPRPLDAGPTSRFGDQPFFDALLDPYMFAVPSTFQNPRDHLHQSLNVLKCEPFDVVFIRQAVVSVKHLCDEREEANLRNSWWQRYQVITHVNGIPAIMPSNFPYVGETICFQAFATLRLSPAQYWMRTPSRSVDSRWRIEVLRGIPWWPSLKREREKFGEEQSVQYVWSDELDPGVDQSDECVPVNSGQVKFTNEWLDRIEKAILQHLTR